MCLGVCMPLYAFHFIIFTLTAGQRKTFLPPRLYALRQGVKLILEVCLVYVCLNLVLIPPGFGKLVAMGTDSPSRWCVMECDLFVPREITFVCVCGGDTCFFSAFCTAKYFVSIKRTEIIGLVHLIHGG